MMIRKTKYHRRAGVLTFALLLAAAGPGRAQSVRPRIHSTNPHYQQGDWISYGVTRFVTSVAVGQQFTYFGTTAGIIRYNFYTNEWDYPFTTSNGLGDNYITAVAYDASTGFLWCGTRRSISYYHPTLERWYNTYFDEIGLTASDAITSIGVGQNEILFETRFGRRVIGNKFGGSLSVQLNRRIGNHAGNIIWFGAKAYEKPLYPNYFMKDGYFFQQEGYVNDFRLRRGQVTSVLNDRWNNVWMGTWRFGAIRGDARTEMLEIIPYGLYSPRVDAIALDAYGMWFGGQNVQRGESGLTFWDQSSNRWVYFESQFDADLVSDEVNRFTVAGDTVFCATRFGVSLYSHKSGEWSRITMAHGLAHDLVHDVAVRGNKLWVATEAGLNELDLRLLHSDSLRTQLVARGALAGVPVYDLEITDFEVWAATEFGVFVYNMLDSTGGWLSDPESASSYVTRIFRYGDELWFGGDGTVEAYNMRTGRWYDQPERNLGLQAQVRALAADAQTVWVGTDIGVYKFNRKRRDWRLFTLDDGLFDAQVNAILLDGDYVWFGSRSGVTVFYWNDPNRID